MKSVFHVLTTACLLIVPTLALAKPGWSDDYAKSLEKAKLENKLVLLDFTGSDWCGWCMKLDDEVFSKTKFKSYAKEHLVLVELDFPRGGSLSKKTKEQNAELKSKFGVSGYPTIVIVDAEGKEVARWRGYSPSFFEDLKGKVGAAKK